MIHILYIGCHPEISETVLRLIRGRQDWSGVAAATDSEALRLFTENDFDLVLLGCGLSDESESELTKQFNRRKPEVPVVAHYGGGSGLLANEILSALGQ